MGRRRGDESRLVEAAQRGDRRALEELVRSYLPLVYNVVGRAVGDRSDIDDVVQETMLRMVRDLSDLRRPAGLRSWVLAIAVHQVAALRRQAARAAPTEPVGEIPDAADFEDLAVLRLRLSGERRQVAQAARWLEPDDRTVLALWWQEVGGQLGRTELAEALEVSISYAAVRVQRMRLQLERCRAVVAALEARPGCAVLADVLTDWDGLPNSLWRKRIDRHIRDCTFCQGVSRPRIAVDRLLVGCVLVPVPTQLAQAVTGAVLPGPGLVPRTTRFLRAHAMAATATALALVVVAVGFAHLSGRSGDVATGPVSGALVTGSAASTAASTGTPTAQTWLGTSPSAATSPTSAASSAQAADPVRTSAATENGCAGELSRIWANWPVPGADHRASYTDNGDGTVRDNVTCLVWQQAAASGTYTYAEARRYCAGLELAGGGWHLPTRIELTSIIDLSRVAPAIDTEVFADTPSQFFWTSSPWAVTTKPLRAWIINFYEGLASNAALQSEAYWVRCVRGDSGNAEPTYTIGAGEVTDVATGLVWQRRGTSTMISASKATSLCASRGMRLPTLRELSTTVDETRVAPAIDTDVFPGTAADGWYWTSDVVAADHSSRWALNYLDGFTNYREVTTAHVRCVR